MPRDHYLISAALRTALARTKEHFFSLLGLILLGMVFSIGPQPLVRYTIQYATELTDFSATLTLILGIIYFIVRLVLQMGILKMSLAIIDGNKPNYRDIAATFKRLLPFLFGKILYTLIILVGLLLLVVPGIIWAIQYQFYGYFIVDKNVSILEAFKMSAQVTRDVKWELVGLSMVLVIINILGAITIFGVLITLPITWLASAYVYRRLQND